MVRRDWTLISKREADRRKDSPSVRGYGRKWRRIREMVLALQPLCRHCSTPDRPVAAQEVDHIIPHRRNALLLYDWANLQPLCRQCHLAKTASGK